jgi:hypothetical protein
MHTLTRRGIYDKYDLNDLFRELDSGVDPTDQDMLPVFNKFKAAGGGKWAEIRSHCEDWSEDEEDEEECGTCGQVLTEPGNGCRECNPSDSD